MFCLILDIHAYMFSGVYKKLQEFISHIHLKSFFVCFCLLMSSSLK